MTIDSTWSQLVDMLIKDYYSTSSYGTFSSILHNSVGGQNHHTDQNIEEYASTRTSWLLSSLFGSLSFDTNNNNYVNYNNDGEMYNNNGGYSILQSVSNTTATQTVSAILDHFPPWMCLVTFTLIVVFFIICCIQTYRMSRRKGGSFVLGRISLKNIKRILFCCCYDSQSQVLSWNIPLQFSFQFLITFGIRTLHAFFLQYFFESTYEHTCFQYLDSTTGRLRRTCPLINVVDSATSIMIKSTYILLALFWAELAYNASFYYKPTNCKRMERITRRLYWAFIGLYYFCVSCGFIGLTLTRTNPSYFLVAIILVFDISIPILFIAFTFILRGLTHKVSLPVIISRHLKRVSIISLILGLYLGILPIVRIINMVLKNFVYASSGYNATSSILEVIIQALFLYLPSIVIFGIVVAPTSISFLHANVVDRNIKANNWKSKWKAKQALTRGEDGFYTSNENDYIRTGLDGVTLGNFDYKEISLEEDSRAVIGGEY
ncbi:predicted protein [Naegleria gruberi]|uniref:Predicted protein n=1 Tax=Naegleria gruberi TaxID=5762 RepID=D2VZ84_NAEGR|nr:uncharacterized protein NAEGRDRAFT_74398 [Naegleria gruberi]EFC37897.1 predicted protein [Naegleria gruberi]|eukprot:XP_002670641.1 predicted protein [Naegleria gruberi strain NEG-M]